MTTPEQLTALVENQRRTTRAKVKPPVGTGGRLDHVPTAAEVLGLQLREAGIPCLYDTFEFHPRRKYRADLAIGDPVWLIVEVDGNGSGGHPGAHRSLKGYEDDRERDAEAIFLGFTVLRFTVRQVTQGRALVWIQQLLAKKENS